MQEASVDFLSSRAFGDQVDGEEEQAVEALQNGVTAALWARGATVQHVTLHGRESLTAAQLQNVARIEVRVERESGLPGQLVAGGAAGSSTLTAPDYVTGPAAAVAQMCELAIVPCVVSVTQIAPTRTLAMYI